MRRRAVALCLLVAPLALSAAPAADPSVGETLLWGLFLPGGGHFRLGEWGTGAGYLGTEAGLFAWGYDQRDRLAEGEINVPWVYALQVHNMGLYTSYRNARIRNQDLYAPLDRTPTPRIAAAPLRWTYMKRPWVYGAALAGAGVNFLAASFNNDRRRYSDITQVDIQGHSHDRRGGTAAYAAYWIPISFGAGVTEEMIFRGMIQPEWEAAANPRRALVGTSALFGLAHLDRPRDAAVWANAGFAFLAGLYLGWRTQENGYELSEAVAAHTWFDITAGLAIWFSDPENNPLGVKVKFAY